jgi:hypothetical protein
VDADYRPRMRLTAWRPLRKNSLVGFVTLELPNGLTIRDISVHESHGKSWAALRAKPMIDGEGRCIRNDVGKIQYATILAWRDRDLADRFSAAVVEAGRAAHPELRENSPV